MSREESNVERRVDWMQRFDYRLRQIENNVALRHEENISFHQKINNQLTDMDLRLTESEDDRRKIREEIGQTKVLMIQIKTDTAALVQASKWLNGLRRFLMWFLPLISSAVTAYVTWLSVKR